MQEKNYSDNLGMSIPFDVLRHSSGKAVVAAVYKEEFELYMQEQGRASELEGKSPEECEEMYLAWLRQVKPDEAKTPIILTPALYH